ncbi:MAG TPA: tetratricopeptide repeat protein [Kofleriaceae bacterium]
MRLALIALIAIGSTNAWAQSKKYPPVTPDKELQDEKRSDLWESTLHPDTRPYRDLVRDAKRLIEHNTPDDIAAALDKLEAAIKRLPKEPEAYQIRGQVYLMNRDWAKCADDLGRAEDYTKQPDEPTARTRARIDLGNCQARAGRYSDAETTFLRAVASAPNQRGELWMRLGEVRIALGKLDEAIDALTASVDTDSSAALTRWLLMAAYDRARRPSDAIEHAQVAARFDPQRTHIEHPSLPLIGTDEADYLDGLAFRYAVSKPEYALVYFRRYTKLAADSPWKRRAEEHVRELTAMKWPAKETITNSGTTAVSVDDMQKLLQKPITAMRQCMAKLPTSAFQITITRVGARTPETVRDRPIYRLPPPGFKVSDDLLAGATKEAAESAKRCLEPLAAKLQLPAPKERDTYYMLSFLVVSP